MTDDELANLFFPEAILATQGLAAGRRLAHYTSAEAGFKIIRSRQVWLRNSLLMNDFSEIQHGLSCLQHAWTSDAGVAFRTWLDATMPGFKSKIEETFNTHFGGFREATFIMSLSEHDDDEDNYGRLSMWRAYGGKNGLALILNPMVFHSTAQAICAFSAPVDYHSPDSFLTWFSKWSNTIIQSYERFADINRDILLNFFFTKFRIITLCTKHPGFKEEREWRVFHSPLIDGTSEWLSKENEIIGGVPQEVVKVHLKDNVAQGVNGLEPRSLLNRVLIGPSENPLPVRHAIHTALIEAGVENPNDRIWMSEIPLRH